MPIITVSRMFGAGGSEVAAHVAHTLGWSLLDNAIVDAVAARIGTSREAVAARDERVSGITQRIADALAYGSPEILPMLSDSASLPPSEERVLEVTRRVIQEAVSQGPAVLVGRGAQCLLAERADALHVYCYAPEPVLIARVAQREGIAEEEAARRVEEMNRQRAQYVKQHWKRHWASPTNYHLCLNTGWLGIDDAVQVTLSAARQHLRLG